MGGAKSEAKLGRDTGQIGGRYVPDITKIRLISLDSLDGRTKAAQRAMELRDKALSERGGTDALDAVRAVHLESWAVLSALVEDMLCRALQGEPVEPSAIGTLINSRRREAEALGMPAPRDITPDLSEYIKERYGSSSEV